MTIKKSPLTLYEREQIEFHLRIKRSKREIARRLNRDHTIIVREVKRNSDSDGVYRSKSADVKAKTKAKKTNKKKLDQDFFLYKYVAKQLADGLSPEQVAGRLKEKPPKELEDKSISYETIYQYIYNTPDGKHWYQYLRKKHKKRRNHKSRKKQAKIPIPNRISIHDRPLLIDKKKRVGDWESDLMEFKKQKECLSVQYERKAQLVRMFKVINKTAQEKTQALFKSIDSLPIYLFKSITFDNGPENTDHTQLNDFNIQTFFCDPYSAWQKGGVENINGLIRQYLPRKIELDKITDEEIYQIQEKLNNRPRKALNYLTPNEVIQQELNLKSGALNS